MISSDKSLNFVLTTGQEIATWQGWTYRADDGKVAGVQTPEGWISHEYDARGAWPSRLVYPQTRPTTGGPVIQVASNRVYDDLGRLFDVKTRAEDVSLPNVAVAGTQSSRVYGHDPLTRLRNTMTGEDGDCGNTQQKQRRWHGWCWRFPDDRDV